MTGPLPRTRCATRTRVSIIATTTTEKIPMKPLGRSMSSPDRHSRAAAPAEERLQ